MTFSILGLCRETGQLGMSVSSSSPAVAARCAHARAGVGVVASQNITLPSYGSAILDALASGAALDNAYQGAKADDPFSDYRQIGVLNSNSVCFHFSGEKTLGTHAVSQGKDCLALGNLLRNTTVATAMTNAFEAGQGRPLAERLLSAMAAACAAGGEEGPVHSAGLLVVDKQSWPYIDLRVDWAEAGPIEQLADCYAIYQPQADDYVTRALDPRSAPSYGVPGDE